MKDWGKLFKACDGSGVYTIGSATGIDKVGQLAQSSGLKYIYIDLIRVVDKKTFLQILSEQLCFPAYFGMNWDAFKDSITDMSWCSASGYVIVLDNIKDFVRAAPEEMRIARDIFIFAAEYWKKQAVSFYVLTKMESIATLPK